MFQFDQINVELWEGQEKSTFLQCLNTIIYGSNDNFP